MNVDDIIPDLNQDIKGEKSLQDIKSTIDQLKRLNKQDDKLDIANIEENLNNKEKLKNIIDKYHNGRIITGVISKSNIKNDNYTPKWYSRVMYFDDFRNFTDEEIKKWVKNYIEDEEVEFKLDKCDKLVRKQKYQIKIFENTLKMKELD